MKGIIAINGHLGSSLAWHLVKYEETRDEQHFKAACDEARWHAETFKHNVVARAVGEVMPKLVFDVGGNIGNYSRIVTAKGIDCVCYYTGAHK